MLIVIMQLLLGFVTTFEHLSSFLVSVQFDLSHQGSMGVAQTASQCVVNPNKYGSALFFFTSTSRQCVSGTFPSTINRYPDSVIRLCNWHYL
jgi:hypothetical protein